MLEFLDNGQLVLPKTTFAEMDGVFVNHQSRAQRIRMAFPPLGEAKTGWQIVNLIVNAMGKADGFCATTSEDIWADLAQRDSRFATVNYDTLGLHGKKIG